MEKKHEEYSFESNFTVDCMGMGEKGKTWYGLPDMRVRGINILNVLDPLADDGGGDDDDDDNPDVPLTQGNSINIEGKLKIRKTHKAQIIATTVVASFIEKQNHEELNSLIPGILINCNSFIICMYDSETDLLLLSDTVLLSEHGKISKVALLSLWIVINHR